jgi:hypothetical protein
MSGGVELEDAGRPRKLTALPEAGVGVLLRIKSSAGDFISHNCTFADLSFASLRAIDFVFIPIAIAVHSTTSGILIATEGQWLLLETR